MKKGEVLFTIDDRTYRAALEQAQATLESQNAGQRREARLTVPINSSIPTGIP